MHLRMRSLEFYIWPYSCDVQPMFIPLRLHVYRVLNTYDNLYQFVLKHSALSVVSGIIVISDILKVGSVKTVKFRALTM